MSTYTAARLAVAAKRFGRPVKIVMEREEDTAVNGGRHPFRGEFTVTVDKKSLKLQHYRLQMHSDGGCTISTTRDIMDRALCHAANSYVLPSAELSGNLVRTNKVSNTAYRGFGAPQSQYFMECAIEMAARANNTTPEAVREANLHGREAELPFGQKFVSPIRDMWTHLKATVEWDARRKDTDDFNKKSTKEKMGICLVRSKRAYFRLCI